MVDYIKIEIQDLPAIYPNAAYKDTKYVTQTNIVADGVFVADTIKTTEKFALSTEYLHEKSTNQLIQTKIYQKYKLNILASEYEKVQLIQYGQNVTITKKDETEINGKIIEIEREFFEGTFNLIYRISFYDLSEDNESINNYLIQNNLLSTEYGRFSTGQLNKLNFTSNKGIYTSRITSLTWLPTPHLRYSVNIPINDFTENLMVGDVVNVTSLNPDNYYLQGAGYVYAKTSSVITIALKITAQNGFTSSEFTFTWSRANTIDFSFYTILAAKIRKPETKFTDNKTNRGLTTYSEIISTNSIALRLYLTAVELQKLRYIYYCDPENIVITDRKSNATYRAVTLENIIEIKENENLTDIFEVDINLSYNLHNFKPYEFN